MKHSIFLIVFMLSVFCSHAQAGNWSTENTIAETTWQAINVIDWGQTLDIAYKCRSVTQFRNEAGATYKYERIVERNGLLPKCPTFSQVNKYFIIGAALHFGASYALPGKYRAGFQWVTIGVGLAFVNNNMQLGLDVKF